MLTKEEKERLIIERAQAKSRAREVWRTVKQLEDLLKTYKRIHTQWKDRFEAADRSLAEEEKLTIVTVKTKPADKLTKEQILEIAKELGINLET